MGMPTIPSPIPSVPPPCSFSLPRLGTHRGADAVPLVLRNPLLLLCQPGGALAPALDKVVALLAGGGGLTQQQIARLLRLSPRVLTMTPYQLAAQFRDMVAALRMTPAELVKMLGRDPKLLQVQLRASHPDGRVKRYAPIVHEDHIHCLKLYCSS